MKIESEVKPTHQAIRPPPIEAWQYSGQAFEEWPDWVRSVYQNRNPPRPMYKWAIRDDEGYFYRWMDDDKFRMRYEPR